MTAGIEPAPTPTGKVLRDFGRAAGGALVFSLPMLMTSELWDMGSYLDRFRLLALLASTIPLLVILSRHVGFEGTLGWRDDVRDAAIALGISGFVCIVVLVIVGAIDGASSADEIIGKVAVQMVPASIGALLARSQFGERGEDDDDSGQDTSNESYGSELFLMGVGALFLGFNVAPTEEMTLIAFRMTEWHSLALVILSLCIMHGFVFAVGFAGGSQTKPAEPWWSPFIRLTLPGYVIALSVSLYLLWLFARLDGLGPDAIVMTTTVLAFPAAVGAAAARLIL